MKQIIRLIITVALAFTVSNISLLSQFGGGNGTAASPYQIHNKTHFNLLTDSTNNSNPNMPNWSNGKYFKLMNNIIDTVRTIINNFGGHFDGNGFKIVLGIDVPNSGAGLFGMLSNTVISTISNVITEGYVKGSGKVGSIVGYAMGNSSVSVITIKNCINNCNVTGISFAQCVGGIAGYTVNCNIENCINNGKISARIYAGGIIGQATAGKIVNCTNTGEISSNRVGGITGCYIGTMENCVNTGEISGDSLVGGLNGHLHIGSKIIDCINIGTVRGNILVGGISTSADEDAGIEISNCENNGLVIGNDKVGGILGYLRQGRISNCVNSGVVEGKTTKTGCIVGEKAGGTVTNCHYDMQMCKEE